MTNFSTYNHIFRTSSYLLSELDESKQSFVFIDVSEETIRRLSFLDGRYPISKAGKKISIPITSALSWQEMNVLPPSGRMIFHTSFCGSTLLANMVQEKYNHLIYREPHILVKLANLRALGAYSDGSPKIWPLLLKFTCGQLSKTWHSEANASVKPSNWMNTLLPDLMANNLCDNSMVISNGLEDFVLANLRGGKSRISYSMELLNHYINAGHITKKTISDIESHAFSPIGQLFRFLCILHNAQQTLLSTFFPRSKWIALSDLQSDPETILNRSAKFLEIPNMDTSHNSLQSSSLYSNAKNTHQFFDAKWEKKENNRLKLEFSDELEALIDWSNNVL